MADFSGVSHCITLCFNTLRDSHERCPYLSGEEVLDQQPLRQVGFDAALLRQRLQCFVAESLQCIVCFFAFAHVYLE